VKSGRLEVSELRPVYKEFFGVDTEEELEECINALTSRLAVLIILRREDGRPIDDYVKSELRL
jgi:hypothetical protein